MPRTALHNDPGIAIELDGPQEYGVVPGDILTGLSCSSHYGMLDPLAVSKSCSMTGPKPRSLGRMIKQPPFTGVEDCSSRSKRTLHSEKDDCSSGEHAWPFTIDLPKSPNLEDKYGDEYESKPEFLPMDGDISAYGLPSIHYYYADMGMGFTRAEAHVEYIFRPSKVSQYNFTLKVTYPTVVQLDHPDPLTFKISIIPDLNTRKTNMDLSNDLPGIRVTGWQCSYKQPKQYKLQRHSIQRNQIRPMNATLSLGNHFILASISFLFATSRISRRQPRQATPSMQKQPGWIK